MLVLQHIPGTYLMRSVEVTGGGGGGSAGESYTFTTPAQSGATFPHTLGTAQLRLSKAENTDGSLNTLVSLLDTTSTITGIIDYPAGLGGFTGTIFFDAITT